MDEKDFEQYLNELYGSVTICGMQFDSGTILKEVDPIAFEVMQADYNSGQED